MNDAIKETEDSGQSAPLSCSAGMAYVRRVYGVPAKRGMKVKYHGDRRVKRGVITSASGGRLRVRIDGERESRRYHPTWEMQYRVNGRWWNP